MTAHESNTVLYIDISEFVRTRMSTGIQRVLTEFLKRSRLERNYKAIIYNAQKETFECLDPQELSHFLENIKGYCFKNAQPIDLFTCKAEQRIFFDMDTIWNSPLSRETLYSRLKQCNFKIYNFIYDLIPILFPHLMYEETQKNFKPYLDAVYRYSDLVFLDSYAAELDFLSLKEKYGLDREMKTRVIYLGADYLTSTHAIDPLYLKVLSKKYILFVGTIEPRKNQPLMLSAFEELYQNDQEFYLVYIGKIGWDVEKFINELHQHERYNKNIYHFQNIDDNTLNRFYKNAFIVTYLSRYEGYGLPIVESLQHANITIVSQNSAMQEVGANFVDYITEESKRELVNIITNYNNNKKMYENKREALKKYEIPKWDDFYSAIVSKL